MKLSDTKILSIVSHHISLDTWSKYSADERIQIILSLLSDLKKSYQLSTEISFDMPSGYETVCGLYDHTISCLFLNKKFLEEPSSTEALYYFFHEFRHVLQYERSDLFSPELIKSLPYIIQYDGNCFKLVDNNWYHVKLSGEEAYFTDLYLSLPYEADANKFAFSCLTSCSSDLKITEEVKHLYNFWCPKYNTISKERISSELSRVFAEIDKEIESIKKGCH